MKPNITVRPCLHLPGFFHAFDNVSRRGEVGETAEKALASLQISLGFERARERRVARGERARRARREG